MGRNNLTIKYMNWTHCQKEQGRRRSAVFKNTDGMLFLSIDDKSAEDVLFSVFQEKKNYLPALKTSMWGFLLL
jgi:hypothetical protein